MLPPVGSGSTSVSLNDVALESIRQVIREELGAKNNG